MLFLLQGIMTVFGCIMFILGCGYFLIRTIEGYYGKIGKKVGLVVVGGIVVSSILMFFYTIFGGRL